MGVKKVLQCSGRIFFGIGINYGVFTNDNGKRHETTQKVRQIAPQDNLDSNRWHFEYTRSHKPLIGFNHKYLIKLQIN